MIGLSAGLTLRQVGRFGMSTGSRPAAALIAAWTSWAATSMLLSRLNCRVRVVVPRALLEVISVIPGIALNCTSKGWPPTRPWFPGYRRAARR